jgi:hypothetical protein
MLAIVFAAQILSTLVAQRYGTKPPTEALLKTKVTMARLHVQQSLTIFLGGVGDGALVYLWSKRLSRAEQAISGLQCAAKETPADAHLRRCSQVGALNKQTVASDRGGSYLYFLSDYYLNDAAVLAGKSAGNAVKSSESATIRLAAARLLYDRRMLRLDEVHLPDPVAAARWSPRILDAELALAKNKAMMLEAAGGYLERSKALQAEWAKLDTDPGDAFLAVSRDRLVFSYYLADAELLIARLTGEDSKETNVREKLKSLAKAIYEKTWEIFQLEPGRHSVEDLFQWSSRWRGCHMDVANTPESRRAACEAHLARMKAAGRLTAKWYQEGKTGVREDWASQYFVADAELRCLQERAR